MSRPSTAGAVIAALLLSGCAGLGKPTGPAPAPAPRASCDAAAAQFALGKSFGPALEREVRAKSGANVVRWLSPGQVMTLEHNAARVNLTLDGRGQIVKATCG